MTYLKQFARNRRSKENTKVLTARLPESLYDEFQTYCNELGLSISEAICLLVDKEVSSTEVETRNMPIQSKMNDDETITSMDEYMENINTGETNTLRHQNAKHLGLKGKKIVWKVADK